MLRERNRPPAVHRARNLDHRPFKTLGTLVRPALEQPPAPKAAPVPKAAAAPAAAATSDSELFLREVAGVARLDHDRHRRVAPSAPEPPSRTPVDEAAEALAALAEIVAGRAEFDIADTDEYLEGAVVGLDPRLVRRLRRGEFAARAHLDLHGMTAEAARGAVDRFLLESYRAGQRCVLIVHGKGRNSKDQIPVLKTRLSVWLARGQWSRLVLAFTSARPCDGGTGALYVLLRRDRAAKKTITVTEGAGR